MKGEKKNYQLLMQKVERKQNTLNAEHDAAVDRCCRRHRRRASNKTCYLCACIANEYGLVHLSYDIMWIWRRR